MLGGVSDWDRFLECVPWFVEPGSAVVVGPVSSWARGPLPGFSELSALLASATVTPVSVAGRPYELLAWGRSDDRRGWLCQPPSRVAGSPAFLERLWAVFGGIVEQFGGPSTLWLNQNEVLTVSASRTSFADVVGQYDWLWTDEKLPLPGEELLPFVTVAIEANGNLTAAHGETGRLVLFAPDHSFDSVTPLPGCPRFSLYSFDAMPDVWSWVESVARDWQAPRS